MAASRMAALVFSPCCRRAEAIAIGSARRPLAEEGAAHGVGDDVPRPPHRRELLVDPAAPLQLAGPGELGGHPALDGELDGPALRRGAGGGGGGEAEADG